MDWERIWKEHAQELYRYIYYKVGNPREAEDLAQETFIRLIRSGKTYGNGDAPIIGLLKRTAIRLIIDRWRSAKHRRTAASVDEAMLGDGTADNPERRYIEQEEIREALGVLNEDQRRIVQLRILQGFSVKETAELTGKTEVAVRTLQFRAVRHIQQTLGVHAGQGDEKI